MSSDRRINIFQLLKNEGRLEKVLVFPAIKREDDPTEHTTSKTLLNPIAIEALVRNVSTEALAWHYYGLIPSESKEIIVEKKYKELLKLAEKIQIGDDFYKCFHDDQKGFGVLSRQEYIVVILELKNI